MQRRTRLYVTGPLTASFIVGVAILAMAGAPRSTEMDQLYKDFLKWEEGTWDATISQIDPRSGESKVTMGVQTDQLRACGQWLITELTMAGATPGAAGSFEGFGILGFDPSANMMVGTWVDSLTDFVGVAKGTLNKKGDRLTLRVPTMDPVSGTKFMSKWVVSKVNSNTRELQIFASGGHEGKNVQIATIRSVRRPD